MTKKQKILNTIFLLLLIGTISYLSVSLYKEKDYKVELITLEGESHLAKEEYMQFAELLNRSFFENLTLQIIKDRVEKHPYIEKVNVRYDGGGKVSVKIKEKNIESMLSNNDRQFLLTDKLQVLPLMPRTKKVDYPIISNPVIKDSVKVLTSLKKNIDVLTASKILSGIKLLNPELHGGLSSIDMRKGGDAVLYFNFIDYPVVLGKGNEIRKIVYFNNFWTYLKGKEINSYMDYIDLRYNGHIFFGINQSAAEEKKS